ncbi:putative CCDC81 eukaryotic HU domain 1 [Monocercomonoides exilis]|uniref:putative CCDC81 eukaryotic HU domain 1 n=1 Tax=Monocercomonoides exilis TaxID=2049356 RepID=UPI00355A514B|nr:putative CCDC81 eukaryotic HU domain 1 [Monocercomonoides exilis]|eukprot:MONOS_6122.1-p1 / transcript=MONOS_6122.1 / gene=MONOS_6122 / organism=Monocercomonoides_exilis_PA203 / gene_product=unspecified product / transcript_product=unspecified product / location=Mono_scaffold00188:86574-89454(+) / protein_length=927 / sequence_SO=supercontig / SO=protein_coding / is_pseudo=false
MTATRIEISELASQMKGAPSSSQILTVWEGCTQFLDSSMSQGKGVGFPDFGIFTFSVEKSDIGTRGALCNRRPTFHMSAAFSGAHGVTTKVAVLDTSNVPHVPLNFSAVGAVCGVTREEASQGYKYFLLGLGQAIHQKRSIRLDFRIATFTLNAGSTQATMSFKGNNSLRARELIPHTESTYKFQATRSFGSPIAEMRRQYMAERGLDMSATHPSTAAGTTRRRASNRMSDGWDDTMGSGVSTRPYSKGGSRDGKRWTNPYDAPKPRALTKREQQDMRYKQQQQIQYIRPERRAVSTSSTTRSGTRTSLPNFGESDQSAYTQSSDSTGQIDAFGASLRRSGRRQPQGMTQTAQREGDMWQSGRMNASGYTPNASGSFQQNPQRPSVRVPQRKQQQIQSLTSTYPPLSSTASSTLSNPDLSATSPSYANTCTNTRTLSSSLPTQGRYVPPKQQILSLRSFGGTQTLKPVEGLDYRICRICHRYSECLPAPNMCSMCIARATQIAEKEKARLREIADDEAYQQFAKEKDSTALDSDKEMARIAQMKRDEMDRYNHDKAMQKTRDLQSTGQDAFLTGTVPMGDPFARRPEDGPVSEERKAQLRRALEQQIVEQKAQREAEAAEEREYGARAREIEIEDLKRRTLREQEEKQRKIAEQDLILKRQMAEERMEMPAIVGYPSEGDPFTLHEDEAPEIIAARKETLRRVLQLQMDQRKKEQKEQIEKEQERELITAQLMKEELEREADEKFARDAQMQAERKAALEKQIKERKYDSGIVGYEASGDPFTKGEAEAEVQQRKLATQRKLAEDYRKQLAAAEKKKDDERKEMEKETELVKAEDAAQLEMDRLMEEEHKQFTESYGKLLAAQMEEQKRRREKESYQAQAEAERALFGGEGTLLSPMIGEAPDMVDCEQPYYRKRKITKRERLTYGF